MVTTPNLEKYRQGDFVQYMNNVLEIVTEQRAKHLQVEKQRSSLKTLTDELNEAWQPMMGSELTPEIVALDQQRDLFFTGLKLTVDNWATNHYNPEWRSAAFMLSENIAGHGERIVSMRYQQETATLNAIFKDFENELSAHVKTLELGKWVSTLKTLNTDFNHLYVKRTQSISGFQPGHIDASIVKVTEAFRTVKTIFEARFSVSMADESDNITGFQQVENEWSTLSQQYNDAVSRYSGSEPEASPEEDAESTENT